MESAHGRQLARMALIWGCLTSTTLGIRATFVDLVSCAGADEGRRGDEKVVGYLCDSATPSFPLRFGAAMAAPCPMCDALVRGPRSRD
jgi:hypothetical protein